MNKKERKKTMEKEEIKKVANILSKEREWVHVEKTNGESKDYSDSSILEVIIDTDIDVIYRSVQRTFKWIPMEVGNS